MASKESQIVKLVISITKHDLIRAVVFQLVVGVVPRVLTTMMVGGDSV